MEHLYLQDSEMLMPMNDAHRQAIPDAQRLEVNRNAFNGPVGDARVLVEDAEGVFARVKGDEVQRGLGRAVVAGGPGRAAERHGVVRDAVSGRGQRLGGCGFPAARLGVGVQGQQTESEQQR